MKVVIARHCETDCNAQGRIQGQMDTVLNATGVAQAKQLAASVVGLGIELLVASDLKRAMQTAAHVSLALGLPIWAEPRLRECSFGSLDGLSFVEFGLRCGIHNLGKGDPLKNDFTPFGGELGTAVFARQKQVLDELKTAFDDRTIMIIGHGRSLRTLLQPLGHPKKFLRTQGTYQVIEY
jgi:probable phosphoglycerate mutase